MIKVFLVLLVVFAAAATKDASADMKRRLLSNETNDDSNMFDTNSRRNLGVCDDSSNGNCDSFGDCCDEYHAHKYWCGRYDTSNFKSKQMCCACGGGDKQKSCGNVVYRLDGCQSDEQRISLSELRDDKKCLCTLLRTWSIVHWKDFRFDGPGYGCNIMKLPNGLGASKKSFCKPTLCQPNYHLTEKFGDANMICGDAQSGSSGETNLGGPNWPNKLSSDFESQNACANACNEALNCKYYIWFSDKGCRIQTSCDSAISGYNHVSSIICEKKN